MDEIDALLARSGVRRQDTIEALGARGRARVRELLATDTAEALRKAREVAAPWYRCQSLAAVAAHLEEPARSNVLEEAFAAADATLEPNRIVTVAAWPLEVLVLDGAIERAMAHLERLADVIDTEPNPIRRMHGWGSLYLAVEQAEHPRERAFPPLLTAVKQAHGWRRDHCLAWLAASRERLDPGSSASLLELIETPRMRRRAQRRLGLRPDTAPDLAD